MEITREEAIDYNKNLRMYMRLSDKNQPCKFLEENYIALDMAIKALELEPCEDAISRQAVLDLAEKGVLVSNGNYKSVCKAINDLPPVNLQVKTGHWIYKIYGDFHEQGDWHCSHCNYRFNYGEGHAEFCPKCGYEMSEPSTEEVTKDRDYDWIIRR